MRLLEIQPSGAVRHVTCESNPPRYAILSHTWSTNASDEVSFEDVGSCTAEQKPAYEKVKFCIDRAKADGLQYFWIDTCCINKANNTELAEAIRLMFKWYSEAEKCYVLLSDVCTSKIYSGLPSSFRNSRWFKRGWTLQELLAPRYLELYSAQGICLGSKHTLAKVIEEITGIPHEAITNKPLSYYAIEERSRWQDGRQTSKPEDIVYSMLGMFNIDITIRYGEGESRARRRLERKLQKLERDQASLLAHHSIPFGRDSNYIRPAEFDKAQELLSGSGSCLILVGLGGIGKSQLAIEYCHELKALQPNTSVLWISSSTAARFDQGVRNLLNEFNVPGREEETADVFQLMHNWLKEDGRQWVIILDSLDDADFLFDPPEQDQDRPTSGGNAQTLKSRWDYISLCSYGMFMITTRDRAVAHKLGYGDDNIVTMAPHRKLAEKLIEKRLGKRTNAVVTQDLAAKLEYIPLAIVQATAYITISRGRCTPRQYTAKLDEGDDMMVQVLGEHPELQSLEYRRDIQSANNSILKTWQMSFEHIWNTRKSAACLLAIMSFYNNQQIPEWLLKAESTPRNEHIEEPGGWESVVRFFFGRTFMQSPSTQEVHIADADLITYSTETFEDDIRVLRGYSLIEMVSGSGTFQMHRLVQLAAQVWLKSKGQRHQWWQSQSLRKLAAAFYGHGAYERWNKCRTLYPHAKLAYDFEAEDHESQHAQASVLYAAAWFANEKGAYIEAENMIRKSKEIFVRCRSETHRDTLAAMCELAWTMWNQQRWKDTEEIQRAVLNIRQHKLGRQHPATLLSMSKLALTLRHTDRGEEARRLEKSFRTTQSWFTSSTSQHGNTLSKINSLEVQFWGQGQWNEAEELQSAALETCRSVLGEHHRDTLMVKSHLAATFLDQGRLDKAQGLLTECIEKQKQILGPGHPQTKDSICWLEDVDKRIGKRLQMMEKMREPSPESIG